MKYISKNTEETYKIASKIAKLLKKDDKLAGGIIALIGELGAGKTTFTQGLAKSFGIEDKIISPTFTVIRQHPVPNTNIILYHIDLYRVDDYKNLGLEELISDPDALVVIEWAEKILSILPKNTRYIYFKNRAENIREITLETNIK